MNKSPLVGVRFPPSFCQYAGGPCDQQFSHVQESDVFVAYASQPLALASTIEDAVKQLRRSKPNHQWVSWKDLSIGGQIIFCEICKAIRFARIFVADISVLNFNVMFELGYAIGLGKPVRLLRDTNYARDAHELEEFGILDTIGYENYSTADGIVALLLGKDPQPLGMPEPMLEHRSSPIYVVLPASETEGIARLTTSLKQSAFKFRVFDAKETPRLSLSDLTRHVSGSVATVLPILDENRIGATVHNARCAFVAGLALARGLHVLMVQEGNTKQPIDYRDLCQPYDNAKQVSAMVERLVKQVATTVSSSGPTLHTPERLKDLERLDLGDVAAENEDEQLPSYFVKTAQFQETIRGHARLVVGRKGTGKSAIFSQLRDNYIRRTHDYLILDLRPEGYQLSRLVELLRDIADAGTREQLSTTLWYYILLTELANCALERDTSIAYRDPETLKRFRALADSYEEHTTEENDFSDRLMALITRIKERFPFYGSKVSSAQVNESIWSGDLKPFTAALSEYLHRKKEVWILVDNLDKSWPARGATDHELLVLRCLLEASRKLQKLLERQKVPLKTVVFIRNDIFEELISETPDRGKESYVHLDQVDHEVLKQILRLRAVASLGEPMTFEEFEQRFFDLHVGGEDTFRFLFRHTFGRARDVLRLIKRCIETSLNRGHGRVSEDDVRTAVAAHSDDVLRELIYEIRDSHGEEALVVEEFLGAPQTLSMVDLEDRVSRVTKEAEMSVRLIDALVWYSFLGVLLPDGTEAYAYEEEYNVARLMRRGRINNSEPIFVIHPAFRAALHIDSQGHLN